MQDELPPNSTHLMLAVINNDEKHVEMHYKNGSKQTNSQGFTALMYACQVGNLKIIELLLEVEDLHSQNSDGLNCLDIAHACNKPNVVAFLQKYQRSLNQKVAQPNAPLLNSLQQKKYGQFLNYFGMTDAEMKQRAQRTKELLQNTNSSNSDLWFKAVLKNDLSQIKQLVEFNQSSKNKAGYTALMIAASKGFQQICALLKMELQQQSTLLYTALMLSVQQNHLECTKVLLGECKMQNKQGLTALMIAVHNNFHQQCKLLAKYESTMKDNEQNTALMIATDLLHLECSKILAPVELNIEKSDGTKAISIILGKIGKKAVSSIAVKEFLFLLKDEMDEKVVQKFFQLKDQQIYIEFLMKNCKIFKQFSLKYFFESGLSNENYDKVLECILQQYEKCNDVIQQYTEVSKSLDEKVLNCIFKHYGQVQECVEELHNEQLTQCYKKYEGNKQE